MASRPPVLRGELADGGVIDLLRECEARRLTGTLRFVGSGTDKGIDGVVRLFGGEIAVDQEARDDGADPVDVLLELEVASYTIEQNLPPLPVSRGTDVQRAGSLAVHVPVDLMSYCEHAGLTGVLELTHRGRKAEAIYEGGELLAIELDGRDATDLHEVFAWEQGRFKICLDPEAPKRVNAQSDPVEPPSEDGWSPAPPEKREDTRQFLRVVEMALVDVLDRSEKARSPTRTSPPLPPPPKARPRPPSAPPVPARRRDDQTVRLIYLTGEPSPVSREDAQTSTRHVRSGASAETVGAAAELEQPADERKPMAKKRRKKKAPAAKTAKPASDEKKAAAPKAEVSETATSKAALSKAAAAEAPAEKPAAPPESLKQTFTQIGQASAWALGVLLLGVFILFVLGKLPPVQ